VTKKVEYIIKRRY